MLRQDLQISAQQAQDLNERKEKPQPSLFPSLVKATFIVPEENEFDT